MNIYLIGYRCCGKTSVGKYLSRSLNLRFIDADAELERVLNTTIPQLTAEKGWEYFRQCEREILSMCAAQPNHIVATGGGAVIDPHNRHLLKTTGAVIWLNASADTIRERMQSDEKAGKHRPALTQQGLLEEITEVLEARRMFYQETGDIEIQTDGLSVEAVGRIIINYLESIGGQHGW